MPRRYTDIRRGGELKTALDNKTAWDLNTKGARTTKRLTGGTGNRRAQEIVGIIPFTRKATAANAVLFLVSIQKASFDDTASFGSTEARKYFDGTPAGGNKTYDTKPSGFSPARMTTFTSTATGTTFSYKQAKATKMWYPDRPGTRRHYPIGRLTSSPDTTDEVETKKAIRTALANDLGGGKTLTFKDEKAGGLT